MNSMHPESETGSSPGPTGRLQVRIRSGSVYLREHLPVSIRDSSMRLVEAARATREFQLPVGLYQVSAVLEDGREHSEFVRVDADAPALVELGVESVPARPEATPVVARGGSAGSIDRPRAAPSMPATEAPMPTADAEQMVVLLDVEGAELVAETLDSWTFRAVPGAAAVASASFQVGRGRSTISLPASNHGGAQGNRCVVRVQAASYGHRVEAWIAPTRIVANALQNMLAQRQLMPAADMAGQATDLLQSKYADPTGAALGALVLNKVDRLLPLQGWLANLVRDFPWLPDGKVLLASLLVRQRGELDHALELALVAAGQRLLFTETFSILLDLLRRWPSPTRDERHLTAIATLSDLSPHVDWQAICLSHHRQE